MWKFLNEATIDLEVLAALEQFEDEAGDRLLIAVLEEYEIQAQHKRSARDRSARDH